MPLPNPGMDAVPFTPITSQWGDEIIENIEALQDWSAFDDGTFPSALINADADGFGFLEIARATLGSNSDTISVTGIPAYKYLKFSILLIATGGTIDSNARLNNDSGTNYSQSLLYNNSGSPSFVDSNGGTAFAIEQSTVSSGSLLLITFNVINISNVRKLISGQGIYNNGSSATRPSPILQHALWDNVSSQINRLDIINSGTGDYATGSEVIVYGNN